MNGDNVKSAAFGGKKSPRQILTDIHDELAEADACVIVFRDKEGYMKMAWSSDTLTERLGILEIAKLRMPDAALMEEDD